MQWHRGVRGTAYHGLLGATSPGALDEHGALNTANAVFGTPSVTVRRFRTRERIDRLDRDRQSHRDGGR